MTGVDLKLSPLCGGGEGRGGERRGGEGRGGGGERQAVHVRYLATVRGAHAVSVHSGVEHSCELVVKPQDRHLCSELACELTSLPRSLTQHTLNYPLHCTRPRHSILSSPTTKLLITE